MRSMTHQTIIMEWVPTGRLKLIYYNGQTSHLQNYEKNLSLGGLEMVCELLQTSEIEEKNPGRERWSLDGGGRKHRYLEGNPSSALDVEGCRLVFLFDFSWVGLHWWS